ncbi:MAG: TonB-dependent receptor [Candidatus Udaeobacter sp.]
MQNRSVWFFRGSASVPDAGFGVAPKRSFLNSTISVSGNTEEESAIAGRARQHPRRARYPLVFGALFVFAQIVCHAQQRSPTPSPGEAEVESVIVSATRFDIPLDQSPASASVISSQELEQKQIQRVSDALREVPGLSVVQTGVPGQLTSVFTRGLRSEHTQVLLDGIPINQGLQGAFNFADFTTEDIDRIEVVRGPQSTIYGPRALAGVIQIFTKQGSGTPGVMLAAEGGSYDSFREWSQSDGKVADFDYSVGASRFDTENARPNNNYRNTAAIADVGWSPKPAPPGTRSAVASEQLRIGSLFTYSVSDIGLPNTIFDPRPIDHFLTERWLIGPHIDWKPTEWWDHKFIVAYDHERQINEPNEDGFVGATRAVFERTQVDYQNNLRPVSWLTLTSGFYYSRINAGEERPFVLFGPTFISDHTNETAEFLEATLTPVENLIFVGGGRFDHFNQFGGIWTYRFAGSYKIDKTNTVLHSSVGTGFSPPSSQDKIFGNNFGLKPEEDLGWDIGIRQQLWQNRVDVGLTYFHNDLSNVIGFNGLFDTLNLGSAETQGLEAELHAQPIPNLVLTATYTYLEAEKTSSKDVSQLQGARLPRRPRNEVYVSASYLWWKGLRTVVEAKFVNAREELNFGGPNFDIEDYSFVNIAAEYEFNAHLSVFGRIDNLTNEHYSEVFGFPTLGRAAYGGVKLRF